MVRRPNARDQGYAKGLADAEQAIVEATKQMAPQITEESYLGLNSAFLAVQALAAPSEPQGGTQ